MKWLVSLGLAAWCALPLQAQERKGGMTDSMKPHNCIFDFPSHGCGRFEHPI
jgi:hypothetical protein